MDIMHYPLKSLLGGTRKDRNNSGTNKQFSSKSGALILPGLDTTLFYEESVRSFIKEHQPISLHEIVSRMATSPIVISVCISNLERARLIRPVYSQAGEKHFVSFNWKGGLRLVLNKRMPTISAMMQMRGMTLK